MSIPGYAFSRLFSSYAFNRRLDDFIARRVPAPSLALLDLEAVSVPERYHLGEVAARQRSALFITARFRSGSTFLWSALDALGAFTSYYEPLNERRWFSPELRGSHRDATHPDGPPYWKNYEGLEHLDELFDPDWGRRRLFMSAADMDWRLYRYITALVEHAGNLPLLQFNRIDFRLPWIRAFFPAAKILHLYRHPREQWVSAIRGLDVSRDISLAQFAGADRFYLCSWLSDLKTTFRVLDLPDADHPYRAHYLLWRLSYIFGRIYADVSIDYESLAAAPETTLKEALERLDLALGEVEWARLLDLAQGPRERRWPDYADDGWFAAHEACCEAALAATLGATRSPPRQARSAP